MEEMRRGLRENQIRLALQELEAKTPQLARLLAELSHTPDAWTPEVVAWTTVLQNAVSLVNEAELNLRRLLLAQAKPATGEEPEEPLGREPMPGPPPPEDPAGGALVGARVPTGPRAGEGGAAKTFEEAAEPARNP